MNKFLMAALALLLSTSAALADGGARYEKEAKIKREEAKAIAVKEVPGTVLDCDLEKRRKKPLTWVVDVKPTNTTNLKKEVRIDAMSGQVLGVNADTDDN
jgi:uncharacterized membrane protein YkoI